MITDLLIGADPELFLEKDGEIISAEGLIGGTKYEPKPISDKGHCIQEDNIMIEFNIPASASEEDFVDNINYVKDYLEVLAEVQGGKLNFEASANLDKKYLKTEQAKMFGCEPDYNVYLKKANIAPKKGGTLRTCGGHIHIGYNNPSQDISEKIVYAMDAILGLESVTLDKDDRRKEMYGTAGSFRFKKYGVEYRTLSNFWITNDESIKWAFNKTVEAIELVNSGVIDIIIENFDMKIQESINTNNKILSIQLSAEIEKILQKELIIKK